MQPYNWSNLFSQKKLISIIAMQKCSKSTTMYDTRCKVLNWKKKQFLQTIKGSKSEWLRYTYVF